MDGCRWRMPAWCAVIMLALLACDRSRNAVRDTREQQDAWLEGPESYLSVWYYGVATEYWPFVRVEIGKGPGAKVISGGLAQQGATYYGPVPVPTGGSLAVRVSLVTPEGDTLVRTPWDSLLLAPKQRHDVSVYIADRPMSLERCMGDCRPFTGYPIRPHPRVQTDSLFVRLGSYPKGAVF